MMESMTNRFTRGIGRHPMPIPHSEDSETDEYNVIDSDRQYERIGDRGSSSTTGTSSSRSSSNHHTTTSSSINGPSLIDPLIQQQQSQHLHHNPHHHNQMFSTTATTKLSPMMIMNQQQATTTTLSKQHQHQQQPTHYAESAIYNRRSRGGSGNGNNGAVGIGGPLHQSNNNSQISSPIDHQEPLQQQPLIPESQFLISGGGGAVPLSATTTNTIIQTSMDNPNPNLNSRTTTTIDPSFGHHLNPLQSQHNLDSTTTASQTTTTSLNPSNNNGSGNGTILIGSNTPIYESASCLMRTASGSLYIPSDNKGAFKPPLQSINEFTIGGGGTLKKPDRRLPNTNPNSHLINHHPHFTNFNSNHHLHNLHNSLHHTTLHHHNNNNGTSIGNRLRKLFTTYHFNWKFLAIFFMLLTMALLIAITYIMSSTLSMNSQQQQQNINCPVMVDDILELNPSAASSSSSLPLYPSQQQQPSSQLPSSSITSNNLGPGLGKNFGFGFGDGSFNTRPFNPFKNHYPLNTNDNPNNPNPNLNPINQPLPISYGNTKNLANHHHVPSSVSSFTNIQQLGRTYQQRVPSFGYWHLRYHQSEPSLIKFNLSFPSIIHSGSSSSALSPSILAIYGNRDKPATHTRYDFVEFAGRNLVSSSTSSGHNYGRSKRANEPTIQIIQKEFTKYLDNGVWFFTLYNDAQQMIEIQLDLTQAQEELCPMNCRGHGVCIAGNCKCDPGYNGESCELSLTCPILCSGRGQYLNGECQCNSGWKGKECHLREDECEISNCNGHGDCLDGQCHCFAGYKGEHCHQVDCLDPKCSGHGHCMSGLCICGKGWKGSDCSEPDNEAMHCLPDCSGHGTFDLQLQQCICNERWSGSDCSQERCDLDCGPNGHCEDGECICDDGWTGNKCQQRLCDPRCLEHGQCQNGTCICTKGWNGKHCSLPGCLNDCSEHGECIRQHLTIPTDELLWICVCENGYAGQDCSVALESQCGDNIDNDKDGLVDCADPECCQSKECESKQLCFSASDPQDILLRKQPPSMTATFYQRMQFLIEEESVQSFAQKMAFNDSLAWNRINESRASVIRGQIIDSGGLGITGVRVGVSTDPFLGFTMTRENGWFDLMVNGGGSVTLHFHRDPFKSVQKVVNVPINEIVVLDKIVLSLDGQQPQSSFDTLNLGGSDTKKLPICFDHDYEKMKPIILATWKQPFQNSHSTDHSTVLVESQIVQESIRIPGTSVHLVYHSSRSNGFQSTIELQLTPDKIEPTLRLVYLKISIEGILFEKIFEADPNILYTYAWNRRNVYRQKVYGLANAVIQVGYQYINCANIIWEMQTVQLAGHDMPISEIGGWNLDIHHRYNFHEGILQKGDGSNIYLKRNSKLLTTSIGDGQQRPLHCSYCNGLAKDQRLLAPVALASAPDGSLYIGDFNLIRRLRPDGTISTVVELSESSVAYKYHLAVGPVDGKLYFSDPEKHQIFRIINTETPSDPRNNLEVFVGTGVKCLPGDRQACGDGRSAQEAKLSYPKGIVLAPTGELFIADGTNIRMVDTFGIIHTMIGDHYHKSHWKPISCSGSTPIQKLILRWPTQLAISPLDQTLHILDDHMVLKVTNDKRIIIVAGRPSHCPSYIQQHHNRHQSNDSDDKKDLLDSKDPLATQVFLETPQAITFGPNGDLYIAESDSQNINRVRIVSVSDQRISRFAGADINCSCMDLACQCFSPDDLLAINAHLSTISSIAVTPDGKVHISDQENLRVRTVYSPLPQQNPSTGEYEIVWPESLEVYIFNRHGQHILTKSALTGTLIYTFTYNVNTINGKISSITDQAGNKIYILRDYSNQVKSIENSQGDKCRLIMTRQQGLLQSFQLPNNYQIKFNYQNNMDSLLTSRTDSWGKSILYKYDDYGRIIEIVMPTGDFIKFKNRLTMDGNKKLLITLNDLELMQLDIGDRDISKNLQQQQLFDEQLQQHQSGSTTNGIMERLGIINPASSSSSIGSSTGSKSGSSLSSTSTSLSTGASTHKLVIRKRDTSHLEIESLSSPVIADQWLKMSELWPIPSIMRIIFNSENIKRLEWKYFIKRNNNPSSQQSQSSSSSLNTPKPNESNTSSNSGINKKLSSSTTIGRKLKLNGQTILTMEFDKDSNQQTILDHSNRPILHILYDQNIRPIKFISNYNLTPVALEYDRFGRLLTWKRGQLSLQMEYDLKGRITQMKYGDGSNLQLKYTDQSLIGPTEIIRNNGNTGGGNNNGNGRYLLQYDANGGLTAIMTPAGYRNEFFKQISLGFYKLLFLPTGFHQPFQLQYDEWGRIVTKLLPNNSGRKVFIYNQLNNLIETEICGQERLEYQYYSGTNLIKNIQKISEKELYDYKIEYRYQGSLLKEERLKFNPRSELFNYKLRYKYDGFGHANEIEFELQGRPIETKKLKYSSITGQQDGIDSFIFKRHSANVIQIGDERLLKTIATDSYGRLIGITFSVWNKELFSQVLHYESKRSRINQSRMKYGSNYLHSNYSYNSDGSLEQILLLSGTSGSSSSSLSRTKFQYDLDGNLKSILENGNGNGENEIKIRRDEAGRAKNFGDLTEDLFQIDERGFIISRGSQQKYFWNAEGQLINVLLSKDTNNGPGGQIMQDISILYQYDHKNRLINRIVQLQSNQKIQNRTQFIYDNPDDSNLLSHCLIDSRIISFTYDSNKHLIAITIEGTKYYVATDHLGSPLAVYTGDGVLVKEILRNVWGKILKDSNPSFWLPIDFHGSIRDPLTNLLHFNDYDDNEARIYDTTIAQWLTPKWNIFEKDLLKMIHLYRFENNDPINPKGFIEKFDGNLGSLPMSNIESWLKLFGYQMNYIFEQKSSNTINGNKDNNNQLIVSNNNFIQSSKPLTTSFETQSENFLKFFYKLSMIPDSRIKIPFDFQNQGKFLSIHEMSIAMLPSPLNAVLISRSRQQQPFGITTVHNVEIDKNPIINSVLTSVFNGTYSLPFHLVHHSRDEFFFIQQPTTSIGGQDSLHNKMQHDLEQLHKLGSLVNVSRITDNLLLDSSSSVSSSSMSSNTKTGGNTPTSHFLVSTGNLLLNLRYGVRFEDELNRVARLARHKAVQEAWQHEIYYLKHSLPGFMKLDWTSDERKSLLHSGLVRDYFGQDLHGIDKYPQLADDPTNIRFKRGNSNNNGPDNSLSRKRRNHPFKVTSATSSSSQSSTINLHPTTISRLLL